MAPVVDWDDLKEIQDCSYDRNLSIYKRNYKQFTSKYNSTVVIYACRGFIRLATG